MAGTFTLGIGSPGGTQFHLGIGDKPPVRAGEPKGFPTRTILIVGGLGLAAVALLMFLK